MNSDQFYANFQWTVSGSYKFDSKVPVDPG